MDKSGGEFDLHRLELRFAATRVAEPQAVQRIAASLERCGQLVPCVVVNDPPAAEAGAERLVLIDGYRRVAALRRLGRDTVDIECWACDLTTALIGVLMRRQDRAFAIIEQALLLRELLIGQGVSQHELARRCGHDVSWVNRRLRLLQGLPDSVLAAGCAGQLSSWPASRILVPWARANTEHAERLLQALARQRCRRANCASGLSTTRRPAMRPVNGWSAVPACCCKLCRNVTPCRAANSCATVQKGPVPPTCGGSKHCSPGCAGTCRHWCRCRTF